MLSRGRWVLVICLIGLLSSHSRGMELPSFFVQDCGWFATDIVVASQDAKEGAPLTVTEVYKGTLQKGDIISVRDLPRTPLRVSKNFQPNPPVKFVGGDQIFLFLKRSPTTAPSTQAATTQPTPIEYVGAARWGGAQVSAAWFQGGGVYAFVQMMNPGPTELTLLSESETDFIKQVQGVVAAHEDLDMAIAIRAPLPRAYALHPMCKASNWEQRHAAFIALGECGQPALPLLREMLRDYDYEQSEVVKSIVAAAGPKDAGAELTTILNDELTYWRDLGPRLKPGWWGSNDPNTRKYQNRYSLLYGPLCQLCDLKYEPARKVVGDVRAFWASLPQLNDPSGLNQITEECDQYLNAVK